MAQNGKTPYIPGAEKRKNVVVEIDLVNDFSELPGAALPVPGALALVGRVAALEEWADTVLVFHDWHYPNDPVSADEFKKYGQHCVPGTWGVQRMAGLTKNNAMIPKRTINAWLALPHTMNEMYVKKTFEDAGRVYVVGVATGICIKAFVEDAVKSHGLGGKLVVVEDCVANLPGLPETESDAVLFAHWRNIGVAVQKLSDVLKPWTKGKQ